MKTIIGLEVHLQLATKSKCFCSCSTEFGQRPNSQTCPVCLGFPGSLPVLNELALELAIKAALALNCQVAKFIKFDRKNYFYPDLPKNFQISQYDLPLAREGQLAIDTENGERKIRIRRMHLEEDAGKLIHQENGISLIDFNRCGIPLLEIVSEPDINSPQQAYDYLTRLKGILEYLEVSDCNMEEGSLRCDANISVLPENSQSLGEKVELKNMNSFKGVRAALEYEVRRQKGLLENKGKIAQETRLWDTEKDVTVAMRSKEEAHDYRYFPEPDLVPFILAEPYIQKIRESLPELPKEKAVRFVDQYQIPEYDAKVLTSDKYLAEYFERCVQLYPKPKIISNWIMTELLAQFNQRNMQVRQLQIQPKSLVAIFQMIDEGVISAKIAKELLPQMLDSKKEASDLVQEKDLEQITDTGELEAIVRKVIKDNPKPIADYSQGKNKAFEFLIGQIMRSSRGKANPKIINRILRQELERRTNA